MTRADLRRRESDVSHGRLIDATIAQNSDPGAVLAALEEFAVEASIAKVAGSETLHFVLDENVQIHGGNGFVRTTRPSGITATHASIAFSKAPTRSIACSFPAC